MSADAIVVSVILATLIFLAFVGIEEQLKAIVKAIREKKP